jgi:uncharacterized protein
MNKIDGIIFKQMIISGSNNLFNSYPEVDALNVFPVPDGDTGTNMNLTMSSGLKEIANKNDKSISEVAKAFSRGLLFGARGNSGVILSQIFRGFAQGLDGKEEVDAIELAEAFSCGKAVAYKAVMKPVEGTVLTVVREASDTLSKKARDGMSITEAMQIFYKEAEASLLRTPNLLPVLKQVGVVDSGGAGFCKVIEGFVRALENKIVEKNMPEVLDVVDKAAEQLKITGNAQAKLEHEEFGYCTEFILRLPPEDKLEGKRNFSEARFKSFLTSHGNSIVCVRDDDLVKVHIHTLHPGNIFNYAQQYGEFVKIKVENMSLQHSEILNEVEKEREAKTQLLEEHNKEKQTQPKKDFALISCCAGKGIEDMFKQIGVDYIVSGGQTMNPSTEDFVQAVKEVNAKVVYIFPNNSNIIMAATQASSVCDDCQVIVIPSTSVPQGMVSCMMFNPEASVDENKQEMEEAIKNVKTGQITFSIRDTEIDGVQVKKDEFMGIYNKKIVVSVPDKFQAFKDLLSKMIDDESSLITIFVGEDVTSEEKEKITEYVSSTYSDLDLEVKDGLQPVYSYIISVE